MSYQYLKLSEIKKLTLDINSACNAACPGCIRQLHGIYRNLNFEYNKHMSMETWQKIFTELGPQLTRIVLCGNYGDAGATNHLPEMLEFAHSINPNIHFVVVSNMGINSEAYWERLGNCLPRGNITLQCSIDGLEDTNHIYRRFVQWDKVIRNIKAARKSHVFMQWKYIAFEHSKHQVHEAKKLAEELGFDDFIATPNNSSNGNHYGELYERNKADWNDVSKFNERPHYENELYRAEDLDPWQSLEKLRAEEVPPYDTISCLTKNENTIHIDWEGHVYPCCWFGSTNYDPTPEFTSMQTLYMPDIRTNSTNINFHTFKEIMENDFFSNDLMKSIETNPSALCARNCGKCNNKWNTINTPGKHDHDWLPED